RFRFQGGRRRPQVPDDRWQRCSLLCVERGEPYRANYPRVHLPGRKLQKTGRAGGKTISWVMRNEIWNRLLWELVDGEPGSAIIGSYSEIGRASCRERGEIVDRGGVCR